MGDAGAQVSCSVLVPAHPFPGDRSHVHGGQAIQTILGFPFIVTALLVRMRERKMVISFLPVITDQDVAYVKIGFEVIGANCNSFFQL